MLKCNSLSQGPRCSYQARDLILLLRCHDTFCATLLTSYVPMLCRLAKVAMEWRKCALTTVMILMQVRAQVCQDISDRANGNLGKEQLLSELRNHIAIVRSETWLCKQCYPPLASLHLALHANMSVVHSQSVACQMLMCIPG